MVAPPAASSSPPQAAAAAAATQPSTPLPVIANVGWAGRIFFGSLCAGTFVLGVWQTARYQEKVRLLERRQADLQLGPVEYSDNPSAGADESSPSSSSFRPLRLRGRFRHEREVLVGPRGPPPGALPDGPGTSGAGMAAAPQGFLVVTPMKLSLQDKSSDSSDNSDNNIVLVNRGWVPMQQVLGNNSNRQQQRRHNAAGRGQSSVTNDPSLMKWDRPEGDVTVTVVPGKFEGACVRACDWSFADFFFGSYIYIVYLLTLIYCCKTKHIPPHDSDIMHCVTSLLTCLLF